MKKTAFLFLTCIITVTAFCQAPPPPAIKKIQSDSDKGQQVYDNFKTKPSLPASELTKIKREVNTNSEKKTSTNKASDDPINVKKVVLKNGLTVLLTENHDLPQVFGMVVTKAGGKNDPADATGLAHYLEHMLFKGTETMGTIDYEKEKPYLDKINDLYEELGNTKDEEEKKEYSEKY